MNHSNDEAWCELTFSPNASLVATVRRFVGEFYDNVIRDADINARLVVASHELLENAVRYSVDGKSSISIKVRRHELNVHVVIVTSNRTDPDRRDELGRLLAEIHASEDRQIFYQTLMRRAAERTTGSGLGLGRIHAESELELSYSVEGSDIVKLRAEGTFASS